MTELESYEQAYKKYISKQNTELLKINVALARNYQILPWYLNEFNKIENSTASPRTNPNTLNKILKVAKNSLLLKIQDLTK